MIKIVLIFIAILLAVLPRANNKRNKLKVKNFEDILESNCGEKEIFFDKNLLQRIRIIIFNEKFLIGIGVGIILSVIGIYTFDNRGMSDAEIEKRAMELGMKYPYEMKVIE